MKFEIQVDSKISDLLNTKTRSVSVSPRIVETIIDNYEDGYIDDDEFVSLLHLLGKSPEDYGVQVIAELDEDLMGMSGSEDDE